MRVAIKEQMSRGARLSLLGLQLLVNIFETHVFVDPKLRCLGAAQAADGYLGVQTKPLSFTLGQRPCSKSSCCKLEEADRVLRADKRLHKDGKTPSGTISIVGFAAGGS